MTTSIDDDHDNYDDCDMMNYFPPCTCGPLVMPLPDRMRQDDFLEKYGGVHGVSFELPKGGSLLPDLDHACVRTMRASLGNWSWTHGHYVQVPKLGMFGLYFLPDGRMAWSEGGGWPWRLDAGKWVGDLRKWRPPTDGGNYETAIYTVIREWVEEHDDESGQKVVDALERLPQWDTLVASIVRGVMSPDDVLRNLGLGEVTEATYQYLHWRFREAPSQPRPCWPTRGVQVVTFCIHSYPPENSDGELVKWQPGGLAETVQIFLPSLQPIAAILERAGKISGDHTKWWEDFTGTDRMRLSPGPSMRQSNDSDKLTERNPAAEINKLIKLHVLDEKGYTRQQLYADAEPPECASLQTEQLNNIERMKLQRRIRTGISRAKNPRKK